MWWLPANHHTQRRRSLLTHYDVISRAEARFDVLCDPAMATASGHPHERPPLMAGRSTPLRRALVATERHSFELWDAGAEALVIELKG
jgi:hypothetical protein